MIFAFGATADGPLLVIETLAEAAATVMLQLLAPVAGVGDAESTALALKGKVPAVVGVPVIAPVEGAMGPKPGGSDPVTENM